MSFLNSKELDALSFPDCIVQKMSIDFENKRLEINTDSAWIDLDDGYVIGKCIVVVREWENIIIRRYQSSSKEWEQLDANNWDKLTDICEFKIK